MYKKPNMECEYTAEMLVELQRCAEDPIYFIQNYVKIQSQRDGAVLFKPFPYQIKMLRLFKENRFSMVRCGRQMGKTTVIAAYLLWYACFKDDKNVLVASNKNTNAMDIMSRIIYAYEELPDWLKPGAKYATKHSLEFDNGSAIRSQATTASTGRGSAVSLLMLDELAFVPRRIQDEMWTSVAPTLSNGGSCIISSTPNGDQDLFAKLWRVSELELETDDLAFKNLFVEWHEHPDRDETFRRSMIAKIGELKFRQEYACEFLSSDSLLFNSILLQAMRSENPIAEELGFKFWREFKTNTTYLVGADIGTGSELDFSVINVVDLETMEQVAEFRSNTINTNQLYSAIKWIMNKIINDTRENIGKIPDIYWSFENNGVGQAISALFYNDEKAPEAILLSTNDKKPGFVTTGKNKIVSCMQFKKAVEGKVKPLKIKSKFLIEEMKNFVGNKTSYAAKEGATDDSIASMLVIMQMLNKAAEFNDSAHSMVYDYSDTIENAFEDDISDTDVPAFVF